MDIQSTSYFRVFMIVRG